jgi:hypothetical protein
MAHLEAEEKARARLQAQVLAASAAAAGTGLHPAHWQLHHIALTSGPGDFTPYEGPEFVEETLSPLGELLEHLGQVLGPDYARVIAERGLEAGD